MKYDKMLHFCAGAVLCAVFAFSLRFCLPGISVWIGFFAAAAFGIVKEIWDIKHGTPEFLDFIATATGGFTVFLILKLLAGM